MTQPTLLAILVAAILAIALVATDDRLLSCKAVRHGLALKIHYGGQ
jgi:hypothetical protein